MNNLSKITYCLIVVAFLATTVIYGKNGKILIETQLTRYGPDLKTNTYIFNITPTGGPSFGRSYDWNNNDDDVKIFYDIVQFDQTKYPLNCTISSSYVVKPTQVGGPECHQNDQATLVAPKNIYMGACHGRTNLLVLDLPSPTGSIGNCDNFALAKKVQLSGAGYSWQYQKGNDTQWKYFTYGKEFNENGLNFNFKDVPDLVDYTGTLYIKFLVDYENLKTSKIEIYESDIMGYAITTCSPLLKNSLPTTTKPRCVGSATGSATLEFMSDFKDNSKFLFNLFRANPVAPDTGFIKNIFALKTEISYNTFTWGDIAEGTYVIKYQAQSVSNDGEELGSTSIVTDTFTISDPTPLTFRATEVQPVRNTDTGGVLISAQGGTSPYYYILDYATEVVDGKTVSKKIKLPNSNLIPITTDGKHKVVIVNKNDCIEK
ncbi:hypothetical protein [Flavobacterium sp. KBS0721]|uniref:hypothetical protein n=1 Tax=Flavobacterium sp. KBS0721 TaxID=1179672 RepID=UPI00098ED70A|nr:hypothetical protein [Flavobacterium sp. KBS0721]QDW20916.1 hypothetical protein B0M43_0012585 [Flavobacterium sp. KBS0721]